MRMNARGFVGPLGDDLPSIFPIVAAVILFIGTLFYANGVVVDKNRALDTRQAALGLSYIVTQKGLEDNASDFQKTTCDDHLKKYALSNQVEFLVTIKRYCQNIQFYSANNNAGPNALKLNPDYIDRDQGSDPQNDLEGQTWDYCTNAADSQGRPYQPPTLLPVPQDAVNLVYPVAVPCPWPNQPPTNGLGLINVIVWKSH